MHVSRYQRDNLQPVGGILEQNMNLQENKSRRHKALPDENGIENAHFTGVNVLPTQQKADRKNKRGVLEQNVRVSECFEWVSSASLCEEVTIYYTHSLFFSMNI